MYYKYCVLCALAVLFPTYSYAVFCPTNFNQINAGDTMAAVSAVCGTPDKQETKDQAAASPQEWTYFIPQTVSLSANQLGQGTLKTTVDFDQNGKVINISVNGIGVGATTICNGQTIQLGATNDSVKAACGQPSFMSNEQPGTIQPTATKKITTFYYNSSNPPQTLIFSDGKLQE